MKNDAFLNVVNQEKRVDTIFKNLVDSNSISKEMCKFVKSVGTRSGIMYWLNCIYYILLDETIDICVNQLFENTDTVEGFTKLELKQLLRLATKESYFLFNGLLYKQNDGVAMGSPLGPSLANPFLSYHEEKLVKQLPARI